MAGKLDGQVAVVTGASRDWLGIAQRLVTDGAQVCVTARREDTLAEAVATLGGKRQRDRRRRSRRQCRPPVADDPPDSGRVRPCRLVGQQRRHQSGVRTDDREGSCRRPQDF